MSDRERHRDALSASGMAPYPTWNGRNTTAKAIHDEYDSWQGRSVTVAGRILTLREHGALRFLDLRDGTGTVQLLCRKEGMHNGIFQQLDAIDPGDVVSATGKVTKTHAGEVSVDVESWLMLSKATHPLPDLHAGFKDTEQRARHRERDLLVNEASREVFNVRTTILRALRAWLYHRGFVEVETPTFHHLAGGASAEPFRTHHDALDLPLSLRISPELFLKRLIIGGYEKIFELGKNFRNEGIDRLHNPEFTSCELYQAYAKAEDLLPLTEELLSTTLSVAKGSPKLSYQGQIIDFTPPWPRLSVVDIVAKACDIDLLTNRDPVAYLKTLEFLKVATPVDHSIVNLMDVLISAVVRKQTSALFFLMDAPVELEPLAKRKPDEPRLVQRMQLIAAGMELVKAYTEENDPVEQEQRFRAQASLRGGTGVHPLDADYLEAMRLGLPPTAGWGLGVDRLVMLATDQTNIRDVLFFPLFRPEQPA